jgi:acyl-CoA synthetase (AMP-forming)/AMP-acid ligase II
MAFYDKRDCNGTELRAFAGNFLYSTGANEVAGRHTLGHFDLSMGVCTIRLDDRQCLTSDAVMQHLQSRIARFKLPRRVVFMSSLPKSALGQVLKPKLQQLLQG